MITIKEKIKKRKKIEILNDRLINFHKRKNVYFIDKYYLNF